MNTEHQSKFNKNKKSNEYIQEDIDKQEYRKVQSTKIIERVLSLLNQIEVSHIEHQVNEMHLLESVLEQSKYLIPPRSYLHDQKSFSSIPIQQSSPQTFKYYEIKHKFEHQVINEYDSTCNYMICKDSLSRTNNKQDKLFYIHKETNDVQIGIPFDLKIKSYKSNLTQEQW